jgi:hypothetical protein
MTGFLSGSTLKNQPACCHSHRSVADFHDAYSKIEIAMNRLASHPHPLPAQADTLGEPLTITEVAAILGCSVWTVRQKYLPQGLPHLRAASAGKLVFFRAQIVRWILERQGGKQ